MTFGAMNVIRIQSVILHLVVHLAPRHSNLSLNNSPVNHYLSSSVTFAVLKVLLRKILRFLRGVRLTTLHL